MRGLFFNILQQHSDADVEDLLAFIGVDSDPETPFEAASPAMVDVCSLVNCIHPKVRGNVVMEVSYLTIGHRTVASSLSNRLFAVCNRIGHLVQMHRRRFCRLLLGSCGDGYSQLCGNGSFQ